MIKSKIDYWVNLFKDQKRYFNNLHEKAGISFKEYILLKKIPWKKKSILFKKEIEISDPFWHLHSIQELLIDELYQFDTDNKKPFIVDCGANVGLSIIYFKKLFPDCKILAFEPDPHIFKMLTSNISKFNFNDVIIENKAVWIKDEFLHFNSSGGLGGHLTANNNDSSSSITVSAVRLYDYLKEKEIDLLKIDIEGAEKDVLYDISEHLGNVKRIFIEVHRLNGEDFDFGSFISLLENAGFRIYIKEAWNNLPNPFNHRKYNPMYDLQLNIFGYKIN